MIVKDAHQDEVEDDHSILHLGIVLLRLLELVKEDLLIMRVVEVEHFWIWVVCKIL